MKARLAKYAPAAGSALLLLLAFPPLNLGLVVFVALVPWIGSLRTLSGKESWKSGYLFGAIYMLGQMHFLQPFVGRWTGSWLIGAVPWLLTALAGAWYFALAGWLIHRAWRARTPWLVPLLWAGIEVFRSYIPALAFPWGLVATPLWPYPVLIQTAHYGSIYLVGAWVLAANMGVLAVFQSSAGISARPYVTAFALGLAISFARYSGEPEGERRTIIVGQPGVDLAFGDPALRDGELAAAVRDFSYIALSGEADLLVLPEGIAQSGGQSIPKTAFEIVPGVPILFGGKRGASPTYQSAFAYDGDWKHADKTRLVIFGEFVPGRDWIPFLSMFEIPAGDLTAGEKTESLEVNGMRVGPVICFEALFPDIAWRQAQNESQLLAVLSVDDWYMGTAAPDQLRAASVFRAIETGLPLVRSATLGYTMAVDQRGEIVTMAPLKERKALRAELRLPQRAQPFLLIWLPPALFVLSMVAPFALRRRYQAAGPG